VKYSKLALTAVTAAADSALRHTENNMYVIDELVLSLSYE